MEQLRVQFYWKENGNGTTGSSDLYVNPEILQIKK